MSLKCAARCQPRSRPPRNLHRARHLVRQIQGGEAHGAHQLVLLASQHSDVDRNVQRMRYVVVTYCEVVHVLCDQLVIYH